MLNSFVWSLASFCAVSTDCKYLSSFVVGSICGGVPGIFRGKMEIGSVDSDKENVTFGVSAFVSRGGMEMMIYFHCDLKSAISAGKVKVISMQ